MRVPAPRRPPAHRFRASGHLPVHVSMCPEYSTRLPFNFRDALDAAPRTKDPPTVATPFQATPTARPRRKGQRAAPRRAPAGSYEPAHTCARPDPLWHLIHLASLANPPARSERALPVPLWPQALALADSPRCPPRATEKHSLCICETIYTASPATVHARLRAGRNMLLARSVGWATADRETVNRASQAIWRLVRHAAWCRGRIQRCTTRQRHGCRERCGAATAAAHNRRTSRRLLSDAKVSDVAPRSAVIRTHVGWQQHRSVDALAAQVFPRGLAAQDEAALKCQEGEGEQTENSTHGYAGERRAGRRDGPWGACRALGVTYSKAAGRCCRANADQQRCLEGQVREKQSVVALAHARAEPPTMVVEAAHAAATIVTVLCTCHLMRAAVHARGKLEQRVYCGTGR